MHPEIALSWSNKKEELKWNEKGSEMKKVENRKKFIDTITNNVLKALAELDFNIDAKGDIHRLNYQHFFGIDVLQVTDEQRQKVKAVIFGVIYGKGSRGLAESLGIPEEEAQHLIDKLFEKFVQGGQWLNAVQEFGQSNLYIETPTGMRRHLWGYLHARPSVINAMNRRGPNTSIQGLASNIGIASMRIMNRLMWQYFISQGLNFPHDQLVNFVHDSAKSEVEIQLIPIYLYLMEHSSTTLIHKRMRETYGYKLTVGLELEFQIGASSDRVEKWNFMEHTLMNIVEKEIDWQNATLGYELNKDYYMNAVRNNWKKIIPFRLAELEQAVKSKEPSEIMLFKPEMVKNAGFILNPPNEKESNKFYLG